jgi:hypothetical protein
VSSALWPPYPQLGPEKSISLLAKPVKINPLTTYDLQRRRAVNTLKIKIPGKNMREKPTNTPFIQFINYVR